MKKNDKFTAVCSGYTSEGQGVVRHEGFPFFVKGMLEGEEGEIVATQVKKTYGFGRLMHRIKTSPQRVDPICHVAKSCGGCQLQHMHYEEQLRFKRQKVQDVITRLGKLDIEVQPVIANKQQEWYRNKCQMPVGIENGHVVTGFYRINSNTIIDTDTCHIQSERINEVLQHMRVLLKNYGNANIFRHLLIKHAFATGEVMVVWITRSKSFPKRDEMAKELTKQFPYIKSVVLNINKRNDNVILGDEEVVLFGDPYITDYIKGVSFHISSKSFYQVNPIQTEVLYAKALEFCALTGEETVLDLYCGVGTISMFIAQQAKRVIGIEIVPEAIEDAMQNAKQNNFDNITFVCSDAASYAAQLDGQGMKPDVIVVDPPRKGCDTQTLESMVHMSPTRIVYVSCDPATLARDLRFLENHGYQTEVIQPVDMFSYSHHVENVVLIQRADT